jgi:flagellar hook assembly protein FlgD
MRTLLLSMVLWLAAIPYAEVLGQNVHFNFTDGTAESFPLLDVRSITFSDAVMNLHLNNGTTLSWNVSTIGHYTYDEFAVGIESTSSSANQTVLKVFPNPSSGQLTLEYTLDDSTPVVIEIHDMQGRMLRQVLNATQPTGPQQVLWDGLDNAGIPLASGSYLCRVVTPKVHMSRTVIIQK